MSLTFIKMLRSFKRIRFVSKGFGAEESSRNSKSHVILLHRNDVFLFMEGWDEPILIGGIYHAIIAPR